MKSSYNKWERTKHKQLTDDERAEIAKEIKMMLHASRDCMRNQGKYDSKKIRFVASDGYFGEAFGIIRALSVLGYGYCDGPVNVDRPGNLRYWLEQLCDEVMKEENFGGTNECDHCFERYGKDAVRNRR